MFTKEQLKIIDRAVQRAYQECFIKTFSTDELSLLVQDRAEEQMEEYREVRKIIKEYLDKQES